MKIKNTLIKYSVKDSKIHKMMGWKYFLILSLSTILSLNLVIVLFGRMNNRYMFYMGIPFYAIYYFLLNNMFFDIILDSTSKSKTKMKK